MANFIHNFVTGNLTSPWWDYVSTKGLIFSDAGTYDGATLTMEFTPDNEVNTYVDSNINFTGKDTKNIAATTPTNTKIRLVATGGSGSENFNAGLTQSKGPQ